MDGDLVEDQGWRIWWCFAGTHAKRGHCSCCAEGRAAGVAVSHSSNGLAWPRDLAGPMNRVYVVVMLSTNPQHVQTPNRETPCWCGRQGWPINGLMQQLHASHSVF